MIEREIQEIEIDIEHAKQFIAKGDSLDRLFKNKDFVELFIKGYAEEEAIRLVHIKNDPAMQTEEAQKGNLDAMTGISAFVGFIRRVQMQANQYRNSLAEYEKEHESMLAEQLSE